MFAKKQLVSSALSSAEIDHGIELAKSGDFARALEILWPAAELGIPKAQNSLGVMYGTGSGVPQDEVAAASWYRKAAEQGDSVAQFNLGCMIAQGRCVAKRADEALAWYLKSAEQGNHMAQCALGVDFSCLRPILQQLMSNLPRPAHPKSSFERRSTASGDIQEANAPDAVPTTDGSPVRIARGGRFADLGWISRWGDPMPRHGK